MNTTTRIEVQIKAIHLEAQGIQSLELVPTAGGELPPFTAGSHVDLFLPNGMVRSYSLTNLQGTRDRYVVAINRDPSSKGGSILIHDKLRVGDKLFISPPRNNFALVENAPHTILIAGGIGITPLWAMIQRLEELRGSWELFYSARTRDMMAYREQLEALEKQTSGRVHFNFDHEPGGKMLDLPAIVAAARDDAHFYCCGPKPMLQAFEAACQPRPQDHVHVEYFTAKEEAATAGGYEVVLARTGGSFKVLPGKTILDTLLDAGLDIPYSCMEGICGTCEVKVIEGLPDHRDSVLTPDERSANKTIMICCSGSSSERLVLDL